MDDAVPLSLRQLQVILSSSRGTQFVTIEAVTVPEMKKIRNPFYDKVVKICRRNAVINASYESVTNKKIQRLISKLQSSEITPKIQQQIDELASQLPFVAGPRKWGRRRQGTPFVDYQRKVYLEVIVLKTLTVRYVSVEDGATIPLSAIKKWLKPAPERLVELRDYTLSNIRTITIQGQAYTIAR